MSTRQGHSQPAGGPATLHARRAYFKQLAGVLLDSGVHGRDVGRMVAELDLHVAMVASDPVEELGPVTEVAKSLRKSSGGARLGRVVVASALLGGSVGLAYATGILLTDFSADGDGVAVGAVPLFAFVFVGTRLMRGLGASSPRGRRTTVRPSWRAFALYLLVGAVIIGVTWGVRWDVFGSTAVVLLATSVAVALGPGFWLLGRRRVRVPGDPPHLRGLGWGSFGR